MQEQTQEKIMQETAKKNQKIETPEQVSKDFKIWVGQKAFNVAKLLKSKIDKQKKGEDTTKIDEEIRKLELEISEREAKINKRLVRIYKRNANSGASQKAKKERQERTHKLCNLGGLVEKAGLGDLDAQTLLGMLIQQAEYLEKNSYIKAQWAEKGKIALSS